MRIPTRTPRRKRVELTWALAGFVVVQLAIGLGVDQFGRPVRDPEFASLLRQLTARQAEAPNRPLVLALGSSRTQMGLQAARLSQSPEENRPLVFNFAIPGSGPMMQQVALRRLLAAGVRPELVFLEAMPLSLSRRAGAPLEERFLDPARLDGREAIRLHAYYHQPYKLWGRWIVARLLPTYRHQAELRGALALDVAAPGPLEKGEHVDGYGWLAEPPLSPNLVEKKTCYAFVQYRKALRDGALGKGPADALRDLLEMCRCEGVAAAVVVPPESSGFRAAYDDSLAASIRQRADQAGVPLVDARRWVEDGGFQDGHHLSALGAGRYTERFGREVLRPLMGYLSWRAEGCPGALTQSAKWIPSPPQRWR